MNIRHEENNKLKKAGLATSQKQGDEIRARCQDRGESIDDYITRMKSGADPTPVAMDNIAPSSSVGSVQVNLTLTPKGADLLTPELVQQWMTDRFAGSGLANVEINEIQ